MVLILSVLAVLLIVAAVRVWAYYVATHQYTDEMDAVWQEMMADQDAYHRAFRHAVDSVPESAPIAPDWQAVKANPAIGVSRPYAPKHITGEWARPGSSYLRELLDKVAQDPDTIIRGQLQDAAAKDNTFANPETQNPWITELNPNTYEVPVLLDNLNRLLNQSAALAWAEADLEYGLAWPELAPKSAHIESQDLLSMQLNRWDGWLDVGTVLLAKGQLDVRAGHVPEALARCRNLFQLAQAMDRDPTCSLAQWMQAYHLRWGGMPVLWRVVDTGPTPVQRQQITALLSGIYHPDELKRILVRTAVNQVKLRTEGRGWDEKFSVFKLYPAARAIASTLDASLAAAYDAFEREQTKVPNFAVNAHAYLKSVGTVLPCAAADGVMPDVFQAVLALREVHQRTGQYPDTAEDITSWPRWPLDNEPLLYTIEGNGFAIRAPDHGGVLWRARR